MDYSEIRQRLTQGQTEAALDLILSQVEQEHYRNAFLALKAEYSDWNRKDLLGLGPEEAYPMRITFATLNLLSDYQAGRYQLSQSVRWQMELEKEIGEKLETILTLDRKGRIDQILCKVRDHQKNKFDRAQQLSVFHHKLSKIKQAFPEHRQQIQGLLQQLDEKISSLLEQLEPEDTLNSDDIRFFSTLLKIDHNYLSKWCTAVHHRKANIKLLFQRVEVLEQRWQRLHQATIFGSLGYLLAKWLNRKSTSVYGVPYDDNGFDEQGFDVLKFNREGYDPNGYHLFGFNRKGLNLEEVELLMDKGWSFDFTDDVLPDFTIDLF